MFLFESITYDNRWASQYYEDFYNASEYFTQYLNANSPFDNIVYNVRRCWTSDHKNNKYEVTYVNKKDLFKNISGKKYFAYMYDKLDSYGTSINILHSSDINKLIFFYNIEYDKQRAEIEHQKYEKAFKSDEILNCRPTFEQWMSMICAKFERKSPKMAIRKDKDVESIAAKYIIAVKLNWDDAIESIMEKLSETLALYENVEKYSSMFKKFIDAYAKEVYEVDPEIQNLIDDLKAGSKDVSTISIPFAMHKIVKVIDDDPLVKKYQYKSGGEFQILTTNENVGAFYITEDLKLGRGFYKIVLHLKGEPFIKDKKSHSYKFNALDSTVSSAIRAIYKNDPEELDKIIIKVNKI